MDIQNEIVISGVSGRFPECENAADFITQLMSGVDLVTENDRRFKPGFRETPKRSATIPTVDKFDNIFFGIPHSQVNGIDPRHRILLETAYESIIDAGVNPKELRGTKTGVYVGMACYDAYSGKNSEGRGTGVLGALAANRISYVFDLKGPSYVCDTACSSSFYVLVHAFKDLESGEIDNAIVASANINFDPYETAEFVKAGILSEYGCCRSFNTTRNGYVRAEAVVSFFLQKRKNSRRIYATMVGAKLNTDGYKDEGPNFPSASAQLELMQDIFTKYKINPDDVTYFEAHGTGTKAGDETECEAVQEAFSQKTEELLIGSVKSNMGHAELAAGSCSVMKCIGIIQTNIIPSNLHYDPIDTTLPGINNGKLKVVTENTRFKEGLIAINCFGFGGANGHVVLKPYEKSKSKCKNSNSRLVVASGRTPDAVDHTLTGLSKHEDNAEVFALVDEIHKENIEGHFHRGFMLLGKPTTRVVAKCKTNRPVWFVYSGVGSQWTTMGRDLLKFKVFRTTFDRCASSLKAYGVDLYHLVTSDDPKIFENILNVFVSINAIQIALTDFLRFLGIEPDGYIGHSLGESACAYADGGMTPEKAVLLSYARGYGFEQSKGKIIPGKMLAVGLSYEETKPLLPEGVFVACRNSSTSVTISGESELVTKVLNDFNAKGIFAKAVQSSNFALHTEYIAEACSKGLEFLKSVFKDNVLRSSKWVSTSVPENEKPPSWSKYSCPEYHYNNFRNQVLFDQGLKHIPENAVVIEIGPHGLLQSILKRELSSDITYISLCNRDSADNEQFLLESIGKLYVAGCQPQLRKLYPDVVFPVSRDTPLISPYVPWDHSLTWDTPAVKPAESFGGTVKINLSKPEYAFWKGHITHGRIIMAGMMYVCMVWKIFAEEFLIKKLEDLPIVIRKLSFKRVTTLPAEGEITFYVSVVRNSGNFEVYESNDVVCTGNIKATEETKSMNTPKPQGRTNFCLSRNDVYRSFDQKEQMFNESFRLILGCNVDCSRAMIEWKGEFGCFIENILQMGALSLPNCKEIIFTSYIDKIAIDYRKFLAVVSETRETEVVYRTKKNISAAQCEGIFMSGIEQVKFAITRREKTEPCLETYQFVYFQGNPKQMYPFQTALSIALQIVLQNTPGVIRRPQLCELVSDAMEETLEETIMGILAKQVLTDGDYNRLRPSELSHQYEILVAVQELLPDLKDVNITKFLAEGGFLIYCGNYDDITKYNLNLIFETSTDASSVYLLRLPQNIMEKFATVEVQHDKLHWVENLQNEVQNETPQTVFMYSQGENHTGMLGFMNCLSKETTNVKAIRIDDKDEHFDIQRDVYKNQLKKGLNINVLRNSRWGTYVHFPYKPPAKSQMRNAAVNLKSVGDFSSLDWEQSPENYCKDSVSKEISVFYSGLNMIDILSTNAKNHVLDNSIIRDNETYVGVEFSGVRNGGRVMGIVKSGGISLQIHDHPEFIWDVPDQWLLEEAATVPFSYAIGFYALLTKAQLRKGESVFMYMATDPVGLAMIAIALSFECNVFVTVSNEHHKSILKSAFPELTDKHIAWEWDNEFQNIINDSTDGRGIDIIVNCLTEDSPESYIELVFNYLADNGRYIELYSDGGLNQVSPDSSLFNKTYSLYRILPDSLFKESDEIKSSIANYMKTGLENGSIRPLPRKIYSELQLEDAFTCLSAERPGCKLLIEIRKENRDMLMTPERKITATPKLHFHPDKSYILIGGTGLVGLELVDWLIRKGATKIVINARKSVTIGYKALCFHKWSKRKDVKIVTSSDDCVTLSGSEKLIAKAVKLGPVGGIFHLAMVNRDNSFLQLTEQDFEDVIAPKTLCAEHLDVLTRKHCRELDHFVVFSSVTSGRGNGGQSNYGFANSAMENLCEKRRSDALPGLAIHWGPLSTTGSVESSVLSALFKEYLHPQSIASCLKSLELLMMQNNPICSCCIIPKKDKKAANIIKSPLETVAQILEIKNTDTLDESLTLAQLGMDSLMAAEIKQALLRQFSVNLDTGNMRKLTISEIKKLK